MSKSKYRLVKTSINERWDRFVENSTNGTAFASSAYLESLGVPVDTYYCLKGDEPMAAFFVPVTEDRTQAIGHDFVIYDGLIYRDFPNLNRSQRGSEEFKIQEAVSQALVERYQSIRISLHPSIIDVRPFLWFNYGTDRPKYKVEVRYTSFLDISDFTTAEKLEDITIYNEASVSRRQEIRYGLKKGVVTEEAGEPEEFIDYYRMTMGRQGLTVDNKTAEQMAALLDGLKKRGKTIQTVSRDAETRVGSMAIYLLDNKRAYYLFGANDPEMRSSHTGTAVLWSAFHILAARGYEEMDLEGINSPHRGWFKLSFGGDIRPYYELLYRT